MSRFIFLLLIFIGFTSAQVQTINTPSGRVANGANILITWTYTAQANPLPGTLSVIDNTTKNITIISNTIDLSAQAYQWIVNVPAGTYYLALNDGSGDKYSGNFEVFNAGQPAQASAPAQMSSPAQNNASPPPPPAPAPTPKPANSPTSSSASTKANTPPAQINAASSFIGSSCKLLLNFITVAIVMVYFV